MGSETAQVIYAGLPVGSYGIYRVDLIVPSGLPANNITPLYIAQNAFISNSVTMAVGAAVAHPPPSSTTPVGQPFIFMNIDAPQSSSTISGVFHLGGWAIDTSYPVATVSVAVDGIPQRLANHGGPRPDACAYFPAGLDCPHVAFDALLDTSKVGNGVHTFQVTVTDTAGNSFTSAATNVTVSNNPASYPTHLGIDIPFAGVSYHGVVRFAGWAVNDTSPITAFKGYLDALPISCQRRRLWHPRRMFVLPPSTREGLVARMWLELFGRSFRGWPTASHFLFHGHCRERPALYRGDSLCRGELRRARFDEWRTSQHRYAQWHDHTERRYSRRRLGDRPGDDNPLR